MNWIFNLKAITRKDLKENLLWISSSFFLFVIINNIFLNFLNLFKSNIPLEFGVYAINYFSNFNTIPCEERFYYGYLYAGFESLRIVFIIFTAYFTSRNNHKVLSKFLLIYILFNLVFYSFLIQPFFNQNFFLNHTFSERFMNYFSRKTMIAPSVIFLVTALIHLTIYYQFVKFSFTDFLRNLSIAFTSYFIFALIYNFWHVDLDIFFFNLNR